MRTSSSPSLILGALASVLALGATAHAAEPFEVELFEPLPSQGINHLQVGASHVLQNLRPSFGFVLHYQTNPLVLRDDDGNEVAKLIDSRLTTEFWAALGLFDFLEIGVVLPVVLTQSSADLSAIGVTGTLDGASLRDLRIVPKLQLVSSGGFGIGLLGQIFVPTGDQDQYASDGAVRGQVRAIFDYESSSGFAVSFDGGLDFRPRRVSLTHVSEDNLQLGLALRVPLGVEWLRALATMHTLVPLVHGRDPNDLTKVSPDGSAVALEGDLALQARFGDFVASVGAGHGFTDGVGSPDLRVFALFGYTPVEGDRDHDGIRDGLDDCPDDPEDFDGFEDGDGCPDPDNDKDGILDGDDKCPNEPEDKDGFEDLDGCPDPDNDKDGILDVSDKCPNVAEDKDGLGDEDGCPEDDFDGDGIADVTDKCPRERETKNGFQDLDGCPDTMPSVVLTEVVYFDTAKATIQTRSYPLLDAVADVLKDHPEIIRLSVDGHADERGSDEYNNDLTQRRAASVVDYLVGKGIARNRWVATGYGESRPIDPGHDESAWVKNRRVELTILEMGPAPKVTP